MLTTAGGEMAPGYFATMSLKMVQAYACSTCCVSTEVRIVSSSSYSGSSTLDW
jgi:hypothetical protein